MHIGVRGRCQGLTMVCRQSSPELFAAPDFQLTHLLRWSLHLTYCCVVFEARQAQQSRHRAVQASDSILPFGRAGGRVIARCVAQSSVVIGPPLLFHLPFELSLPRHKNRKRTRRVDEPEPAADRHLMLIGRSSRLLPAYQMATEVARSVLPKIAAGRDIQRLFSTDSEVGLQNNEGVP